MSTMYEDVDMENPDGVFGDGSDVCDGLIGVVVNCLSLNIREKASADSLIVVQGIGFSTEMKTFWMRLKTDSRVGITFDLYDVGLVFFDHSKIKQDYMSCFLIYIILWIIQSSIYSHFKM